MKLLSVSIPGYNIQKPAGVPNYNTGPFGKSLIAFGIDLLLAAAVVFALIMFLISAIAWITSGGDKEKLQKARSRAIFSLVGLVVALLSFFIIQVIGTIFNVPLAGF